MYVFKHFPSKSPRLRIGETCGHPKSDSLTLLKATLERKRIKYRCYDVVGDPNSKASESFLANHAANIIRTWQKGTDTDIDVNSKLGGGRTISFV